MKNTLIAVVAVVLGIGIGYLFAPTKVVTTLGASGSTFSFPAYFQQDITVGGNYLATTSAASFTYSAKDIATNKVILQKASGAQIATLPTRASLDSIGFLQNAGDTEVTFIVASTSAVTLAGNTGVVLSTASTSAVIYPNKVGQLYCVRTGTTESRDIHCLLTAD